jgi:hypothetical protein
MRLALVAFFAVSPILAGGGADCPPPKPLSCERLMALADQRNCWPKQQPCTVAPCPPPTINLSCPGCPECSPVKEVTTVQTEYVYIEAVPTKEKPRPLIGGGASYFHGVGIHAFTGVQFPKTKTGGNWQWQVGANYIPQNGIEQIDGTCRIGCRTCDWSVPAKDGKSPLGGFTSFVYVF